MSEDVKMTVTIPANRQEAFHNLYLEFITGETSHDQAIRQREKDQLQGIASLRKLAEVAQGDSGQCRYIARFLAALYNGPRFRFDPTDLRAIDTELFEHCMAVLRLDRRCEKEVHNYFVDGSNLWEKEIIGAWKLDAEQVRDGATRLVSELEDGDEKDRRLASEIGIRFPREP